MSSDFKPFLIRVYSVDPVPSFQCPYCGSMSVVRIMVTRDDHGYLKCLSCRQVVT